MGKIKGQLSVFFAVLTAVAVCILGILCFLSSSNQKPAGMGTAESAAASAPANRNAIHFLNTWVYGANINENCILLESNGKYGLIDAGIAGSGQYIYNYMKRLTGNTSVYFEFLIATHAHSDHMGGIASLLSNDVKIGTAYYRDDYSDVLKNNTGSGKKIGSLHRNPGYEAIPLMNEMRVVSYNSQKPIDNEPENYNNWSLVQLVEVGNFNALFMADVLNDWSKFIGRTEEEEVAWRVLDRKGGSSFTVDCLQVSHHGLEANSEYFTSRIKTRNAIFTNAREFDKRPVMNDSRGDYIKADYPSGIQRGVRDYGGILVTIDKSTGYGTYTEIGEYPKSRYSEEYYSVDNGIGITADNAKFFLPLSGRGKYYLTGNITVSDNLLSRNLREFTGEFDGRGYTLSYNNGTYAGTSMSDLSGARHAIKGNNWYGILACSLNGATVKNLTFELKNHLRLQTAFNGDYWINSYFGLIAGQMWNSSVIDNVKVNISGGDIYFYGKRNGGTSGMSAVVGGFVGIAHNNSTIKNSELTVGAGRLIGARGERNDASNNISEYGHSSAGGFIGDAISNVNITDCKISGTASSYIMADGWAGGSLGGINPSAGGLVGRSMGSNSEKASVSNLQSGTLKVNGLIFDFKGETWVANDSWVGSSQKSTDSGERPAGLIIGAISNGLTVTNAYRLNFATKNAAAHGGTWGTPMTGYPSGTFAGAESLASNTAWGANKTWLGRYNSSKTVFTANTNYIYSPSMLWGTDGTNGTQTLVSIKDGKLSANYSSSGDNFYIYKTGNMSHIGPASGLSDLKKTFSATIAKGSAVEGRVIRLQSFEFKKTGTAYSKAYDGKGLSLNLNQQGSAVDIGYVGGTWSDVNWSLFSGAYITESGKVTKHTSLSSLTTLNVNAGSYTLTMNKGLSDFVAIEAGNTPRYLLADADGYYGGKNYRDLNFVIEKAELTEINIYVSDVVHMQGGPSPLLSAAHPQNAAPAWGYSVGKTTWVTSWEELNKNPGTKYVRVRFEETGNYKAFEAVGEFKVLPEKGVFTASINGWTYGQSAGTPSFTFAADTGTGANTHPEYKNAVYQWRRAGGAVWTDWSRDIPYRSGDYQIRVTFSSTANYASYQEGNSVGFGAFRIEKAVFNTDITIDDFIHGQKPDPKLSRVHPEAGDTGYKLIWEYYSDGWVTWEDFDIKVNTPATVRLTVPETENYKQVHATAAFKVIPEEGTFRASVDDWVYGQLPDLNTRKWTFRSSLTDAAAHPGYFEAQYYWRLTGDTAWTAWEASAPSQVGVYQIAVMFSSTDGGYGAIDSAVYEAYDFYDIGTFKINKADGAVVDKPVASDISTDSINIKPILAATGQTVLYAISESGKAEFDDLIWVEGTAFNELRPNTKYYFYAYAAENDCYLNGAMTDASRISTDKELLSGKAVISNDKPKIGDVLTAEYIGGNGTGAFKFTFKADGEVVQSGVSDRYKVLHEDLYKLITVEISFDDQHGFVVCGTACAVIKKAGPSAPLAPICILKTHNSVILAGDGNDVFEYSKDGLSWQAGPVFTGLSHNNVYYFYKRVAETADTSAGEISEAAEIKTDKAEFAAAIDLTEVSFGKAVYGSYGKPAPIRFTVTNTGNQAISIEALLGGENAGGFEISTGLSEALLAPYGSATVSVRPKTGLGAGVYNALLSVTVAGGDTVSASLNFEVDRAEYTGITHEPLFVTYTKSNTLYDIQGLAAGFAWVNGAEKLTAAVSSYAAVYNLDPANMKDFNIDITVNVAKALPDEADLLVGIPANHIYGDANVKGVTVGTSHDEIGEITIYYYNEKYLKSNIAPLNAGIYTIIAEVAESINYSRTEITLQLTYTVGQKTLGASALTISGADNFVYDGTEKIPAAIKVYDGLTLLEEGTDYAITVSPDVINAGRVTVTAVLKGNYKGIAEVAYEIRKALPTACDLNFNIPQDLLYNSEGQGIGSVTAAINGLGTVAVFYNGLAAVPVNAGTYTVTVSIAEDGANINYYGVTGLVIGSYTIAKKDADGSAGLGIDDWTYGDKGNMPYFDIEMLEKDGNYGEPVFEWMAAGGGLLALKPQYAGVYRLRATFMAGNPNYNDYVAETEFVIHKASSPEVKVPEAASKSTDRIAVEEVKVPEGYTVRYGISRTHNASEITVWQTSSVFDGLEEDTTYYVFVSIEAEDGNYSGTVLMSQALKTEKSVIDDGRKGSDGDGINGGPDIGAIAGGAAGGLLAVSAIIFLIAVLKKKTV